MKISNISLISIIVIITSILTGCIEEYTIPKPINDFDNDGLGEEDDIDNDNDGMLDDWEIKHGLDPYDPNDKHDDFDQDGVDNKNEYDSNTNPLDPLDFDKQIQELFIQYNFEYQKKSPKIYGLILNDSDFDDDGMPDRYEEMWGLDPTSPADGYIDTDDDGFINLVEYHSDTNPKNYHSNEVYSFYNLRGQIVEIEDKDETQGGDHKKIRIHLHQKNGTLSALLVMNKKFLDDGRLWIEDYYDITPNSLKVGDIVEIDFDGYRITHTSWYNFSLNRIQVYYNLYFGIAFATFLFIIIIVILAILYVKYVKRKKRKNTSNKSVRVLKRAPSDEDMK